MTYALGIDVGTTYSAAAVASATGVEIVQLGTDRASIPSIVVLREDGEVLVGDAAERRAQAQPERAAREFKRRLGDPTPLVVGGTPYGADALVAHILRWIVAFVTEQQGEAPAAVAITHPASWTAYKTDLLRHAAASAGLGEVTLLAEPQAAAIRYVTDHDLAPGANVAVYDFGGGTFDAAVVTDLGDDWQLRGVPEGLERLGGIDLDQAVFAHVDRSVDGMLLAADASDPRTRAALLRVRDDCRRAKEALSADTDAVVAVQLPDLVTEVRITRGELESFIRPRIVETIASLERAIASAGLTSADIARVLLVGGSSRIPLVGEMVHASTGLPIAVDANPKHAIAMGAASHAARSLAGPVTAAIPTETTPPAVPVAAVAPVPPAFPAPVPPPPVDWAPPATGAPGPREAASRSRTPLLVGAVAAAVLLVGVVVAIVVRGPGSSTATAPSTVPGGAASSSEAPPTTGDPDPTTTRDQGGFLGQTSSVVPSTGAATERSLTVEDETGAMRVDVPAGWRDRLTTPTDIDGSAAVRVSAAPDQTAYQGDVKAPGITVLAVPAAGAPSAATTTASLRTTFDGTCGEAQSKAYDVGEITGTLMLWTGCTVGGAAYLYVGDLGGARIAVLLQAPEVGQEKAMLTALETITLA